MLNLLCKTFRLDIKITETQKQKITEASIIIMLSQL
jgi:hypothetical protein